MSALTDAKPLEIIKRHGVRGLFRLPTAALRRMAGDPVVRDGKTLDPEMQLLLTLQKMEGPEIASMPLLEARRAVVSGSRLVGGRPSIGAVSDRTISGPGGDLMLRFYTPDGVTGVGPALLFIHGGGWIYGDLESHDAVCRFLAVRAGVRVVAIDYRLGPEHRFPAAVDDCWAAYRWLAENAEGAGIDPDRIAVGGDSAGGNLATVVAQRAVREGVRRPAFQLLVYPATDLVEVRPSRIAYNEGLFLTEAFMDLSKQHYLTSDPDLGDWRLSPIRGELAGLPPAYLVTAGFDPLLDEGRDYAEAMRAAGVEVEYVCEEGLIHSFANMVSLGHSAPQAMARAAQALRNALRP